MTTAALTLDALSARRRLQAHIDRALMRMRLHEALRATVFSATIALWLLAGLIAVDRLLSLKALGFPIGIVWLGVVALCVPYVVWRTFSQRINEALAATLADDRLGLHSRLCTALTLDPTVDSGFHEAFYAEAAERLGALDPTKAFPFQTPRLAYLLPLPALVAGSLWYFMPEQDRLGLVAQLQEKRRAEEGKRETLKKLEGNLEELKKDQPETAAEDAAQYKVNQLIKKADGLAKQVKEGKRNPEEAIVALADLKREIGEEKERLTQGKDFSERLKDLAAKDLNLEESDFTRAVSEALKAGDAGLAAREMRRLARKIKNEILNDETKTPEAKAEALKKLRDEVEKLAGALEEDQDLKEGLQELSRKSMEAGEFEALQDEVKKQMAKNGGKTSEQVAEELEEEMEKTADEMERLEDEDDVDLNKDEQEAMEDLEKLEDSVDEAMEGLNESGGITGASGEKKGVGESGDKSGKASGKKFSSKSGKRSGSGKGKSGRQGVEKASGDGGKDKKDGKPSWQFSGPNEGGKGAGPRAYRDGDAQFQAEKVRGKMQSGAITGLSHFRGQGAKGDAPAEYVQALRSAEQEMTSSLELDRIPADGQKVVKDYFLRLKDDSGRIKSAGTPAPPADAPKPAPAGNPEESLRE